MIFVQEGRQWYKYVCIHVYVNKTFNCLYISRTYIILHKMLRGHLYALDNAMRLKFKHLLFRIGPAKFPGKNQVTG